MAYYLLAFLTSACIMTLEIVAGRLIAPQIGVNLYTWTSIIGVVLTGISVGSFVGGWMADRWNPRRLLSGVLIIAGLLTVAIIPGVPWVNRPLFLNLPPLLGILSMVAVLFFIPSFFLALVSPLLYKLALRDPNRVGGTVGRLAASGALGSIAGTFATGFWLVPAVGTRNIVIGVAAAVVVLGLLCTAWRPWLRTTAIAVILSLLAVGLWQRPAFLQSPCDVESAYYCLKVNESASAGVGLVKKLVLDNLVHSGVIIDYPDALWYDYEQTMAWILEQLNAGADNARAGSPGFSALFLGGGGYILPHWVERHFPGSRVDVAEIDPEVTRIALKEFIPADNTITTFNDDARRVLSRQLSDSRYDVVIGDAFNDVAVPYHLTTREFDLLIRDRLKPGGIYMMNVVDRPDGLFQGALVRTLGTVFPHLYVLMEKQETGDAFRTHTTLVLVASLTPLPLDEWAARSTPPYLITEPDLGAAEQYALLTDDYAPTDTLLLPVFIERWD
ncbi:MAG: fused MFS/spermidine synthase [Firmicutes bacterium]|nr:fused MFS/spermidine synthase [Bacillota bacterium]